jgi:hypothetical protein
MEVYKNIIKSLCPSAKNDIYVRPSKNKTHTIQYYTMVQTFVLTINRDEFSIRNKCTNETTHHLSRLGMVDGVYYDTMHPSFLTLYPDGLCPFNMNGTNIYEILKVTDRASNKLIQERLQDSLDFCCDGDCLRYAKIHYPDHYEKIKELPVKCTYCTMDFPNRRAIDRIKSILQVSKMEHFQSLHSTFRKLYDQWYMYRNVIIKDRHGMQVDVCLDILIQKQFSYREGLLKGDKVLTLSEWAHTHNMPLTAVKSAVSRYILL